MRVSLPLLFVVCTGLPAWADTFVMQGSTTFADCLMSHFQVAIEQQSEHKLTVIPNKSIAGLLALAQGQADFAMTSSPVERQKQLLARQHPELSLDHSRTFEITRTRAAIVVHPDNPVAAISQQTLRGILTGAIRNWRQLGGRDLAIRVVFVRDGGGVQASVEEQVLDGAPISAPEQIRVQTSAQVAKIAEQEPGALGLAQRNIVRQSAARELATERPIEQRLSLTTLGPPSASMHKVIETIRRVAALTNQ